MAHRRPLLRLIAPLLLAPGAINAAEVPVHPAPPAPAVTPADSPAKIAIVQVPLPASNDTFALSDLPEPVAALLAQGWRIRQVQEAGRSADGKNAELVLVLERAGQLALNGAPTLDLPFDLPGGHGPGTFRFFSGPPGVAGIGGGPGAGAPAGPADKGTIAVHWQDGHLSTITVGEAIGARSKAHVLTSDASGKTEAEYDATAFRDADGSVEVDGRGAPLAHADGYSPDSFRIHPGGAVEIQDDSGTHDQGRTDQAPAGAGRSSPADKQL